MHTWPRTAGSAILTLIVGATLAAPAAIAEPAAEAGKDWTELVDAPPQYPGIAVEKDVPITMSDGVVLRANVYRAADADGKAIEGRVPTVVNLTPYTRFVDTLIDEVANHPALGPRLMDFVGNLDFSATPLDGITELTQVVRGGGARLLGVNRDLVQNGYAQVIVDVRGTGYSNGTWGTFDEREQQDTVEVLDWVRGRNWSNGTTGMAGMSYSAINQIQAAGRNPEGLKAIFPVIPGQDFHREVAAPGGVLGSGFMPLWIFGVNFLKWMPPFESLVKGQFDPQWLLDRASDPITLVPEVFQALFYGDSPPLDDGDFYATRGVDASKVTIPTFIYGGWKDIFKRGEPRLYNDIPLPPGRKQLMMDETYHINPGYRLGLPGSPPRLDVLERAWFDRWLKGIDNGIDDYGPVTMYQQGGGWTSTESFPRPGADHRRMYLSAAPSGTAGHARGDGSLSPQVPTEPNAMTVFPGLRMACSRDTASGTAGIGAILGSACTRDTRFAEGEALTFTSAAVDSPTAISGPINVHLNTVTEAAEGVWHVTVNDVAPDGTSTILSNGALLSSRRAIDESRSERSANGDYTVPVHPLTKSTIEPATPGLPTVLDIDVDATDAVLQQGHRLRVDIFATDLPRLLPSLPDLVAGGLRPQHLALDPRQPSFVNLPVVGAGGWG
ncbi:CocE/NonD family hydrolase [Rhodococcus sp. NPDC055112]